MHKWIAMMELELDWNDEMMDAQICEYTKDTK